MNLAEREKGLLYELQRGVPLVERPFAVLGAACGFAESDVIEFIRRLMEDGAARRFGAVFDARRLGYRSVLCAVPVPGRQALEGVALAVAARSGVTHCYERGWQAELDAWGPGGPQGVEWPGLWFTFAVLRHEFDAEFAALSRALRPFEVAAFPATRRFKIDVVFDTRTRDRDERVPIPAPDDPAGPVAEEAREFPSEERAAFRLLGGNLSLCPDLFSRPAAALGVAPADLLAMLRSWAARGILRRIGLIVRSGPVGFKANGMCVWTVPEGDVVRAGRALAACPEVTHCYERPPAPAFPYNLYAMIHGTDWPGARGLFERISAAAGLTDGRMLCSLREFKKSSMRYFADEEQGSQKS